MQPEKFSQAIAAIMSKHLKFIDRVPLDQYHNIAYFRQTFLGRPKLENLENATKQGLQKFVAAARKGKVKLTPLAGKMGVAQAKRFVPKDENKTWAIAECEGLIVVAETGYNATLQDMETTVTGIWSLVEV